jgi:hypothetical protein
LTVRSLTVWPCVWSATANLAALLQVHRRSDIESPRVTGSSKVSRGMDEVRIMGTQWFTPPTRTAYPRPRSLGGRGRGRVGEFLQAGSDGGTG